MEDKFWHDLWEKSDLKFHQSEVNPCLLKYRETLGDLTDKNIFVPLCGKSNDMAWLYQQSARVTGVEISPLAIEAFFDEQKLDYDKISQPPFELYQHDQIKLLCGDIFSLEKEHIGEIDIVYDRAALIALPPEKRIQYAKKMTSLLNPGSKMLLITMEYSGSTEPERPPFSVTNEEVHELFSNHFKIELLEDEELTPISPHLKERGIKNLKRMIYLMEHA